ncbi:MAG: hypothetical protein EOP88_21195 [Verrucomicrobiaceae bacterium]|nr:MAG: hypothetical protein EOP88_21195 [Verrucomicrobiaceae bacterium]
MKKQKNLISIVIIVLVAAAGGRLAAMKAASDYGRHVAAAFSALGYGALTDTKEIKEFLRDPQLTGCENRTHNLAFLGGNYSRRVRELKEGIIYLSEQASLPEGKRFAAPPKLQSLSIDSDDPSDQGLGNAVGALILDFRQGL